MNEATWRRLLGLIHGRSVVPVVGSRLLVGADGRSSWQARIAGRLLELHSLPADDPPLPPFRELNEAVTRLLARGDAGPRLQALYSDVHDLIAEATAEPGFRVPPPIVQIAEIADFQLFVTLTPDDLLCRSLRQRRKVNEIIHSPVLPTTEEGDLPADWASRAGEVQLLYLFGKSRAAPMFAIHDEDVLEYAHNVIARDRYVPVRFLNELRQRYLLLIGCNFPEWLSRFFLRATSENRLSQLSQSRGEWLIETMHPTESLVCFLQSYAKDTEVLWDIAPVDFVAELHHRWMAGHGVGPTVKVPEAETVPQGAMFFISYSRQTDLLRAEALYQALLQLGVAASEVWFDRSTIEPGQDFRQRILDGIRGCRYFLPLLSERAMQREEGFVFDEWREANQRNRRMNRDFIVPVIVDLACDPERFTARPVKDGGWGGLDFGRAPEGVPDERTRNSLIELVRKARRGEATHGD